VSAFDRRAALTSRDRRVDVLVAATFVVGVLLSTVLYRIAGVFDEPAPAWATVPYAIGIGVPLLWRRRSPSVVAVVVAATFIVGGIVVVPEALVANIALFLAFYSVGAWDPHRTRAHLVRVAIIVAMVVWLFVAIYLGSIREHAEATTGAGFTPYVAITFIQVITNLLYFGGAYFYGERSWAAARERRALHDRTADLEHERERLAEQAVALDRMRIARELHDSVAHHVSVIGVQAGAARTALDVDPAAARGALAHVEASARSAIDDLRGILVTLREDAGSSPEPPSTIGVMDLPRLVEESRRAGLSTEFEVVGEPRTLPPALGLNLYRIAQEALTNARKHGGAEAVAEVRLRYLSDVVELEIANSGRVSPRRSPGGLGQLGIRERVAASGGALEIGPRSRGGYLVRARLPIGSGS
jgi:signal transduction histidine kinase